MSRGSREPFKAGDVIGGKFRVERVLGSGGMGMVVAAKHVELGQRVAVKVMLEEAAADPQHAERFQREARSAVQLQSLHTARVLDVGKLKNGEPFIVMEYLEGEDLDDFVRKTGPLPPNIAVDYILQACEAIAEAHGLEMIHRDIKLKNLFLTKRVDGQPLVKVLDFGLAKKVGVGATDVSLTNTSAVFGSPQYMSPEQMRSAKDVDTRSDIWSMGVCLYELLTGHVPFDAGGVAEICAMVLKDPVPPLSKWVVGLPPELERIVARALEKDPTKRFQSVAELAFALEPYAVVEGSAKRILNVMESARRLDHGVTIVNVAAGGPIGEGARTLSPWDSGEKHRSTTRTLRTRMTVGIVAGLLATAALVAMVIVIKSKYGSAAAEPLMTMSAAPPAASDPPVAVAPADTAVVPTAAATVPPPQTTVTTALASDPAPTPKRPTSPARTTATAKPTAATAAPRSTAAPAPTPKKGDGVNERY
ncbi:MAG TPA: serine/threonine-protein kinase [Labilithrix sp.]